MTDVMVCGCPDATHERVNPSSGRPLRLCENHARLHDQGHGFCVQAERGATDVTDTPDSATDDATAVVANPSSASLTDGLTGSTTTPIGAET